MRSLLAAVALLVSQSLFAAVSINAGGPSTGGYVSDRYYTGGSAYDFSAGQGVYRTERWSKTSFSYAIPVAAGAVQVTLRLRESCNPCAYTRTFSVSAEGQLVLPSVTVPTGTTADRTFQVTSDSVLNLVFTRVAGEAWVNGIEVTELGGSTPPPVPTLTFSATPSSVTAGHAATLSWSAQNAASCSASGAWSGSRAVSGSESTGSLTSSRTYTLTCVGPGGTAQRSLTVDVTPAAPAPTLTFSASPSTVSFGRSSTLSWSATNATTCVASGGWSGTRPTSGSASTGRLYSGRSYTLRCTGSGGSVEKSVAVAVGSSGSSAPTLTFSANPSTITSGSSASLSWSTTNASSCSASGGWSGPRGTSGSASTGTLSSTTTFGLSCTGIAGTVSRSVTVTVLPPATPAPTITLSASPSTVVSSGTTTLAWSAKDADSCVASGGWSGPVGLNGTAQSAPITSETTFTLTCVGAGGTRSASAIVNVTASATTARFPLHVEPGKRYLIDADGKPFLIHGDTPWSLEVQLTREQVEQYLETRRTQGFNTILFQVMEHEFSSNPPKNAYGDEPFLRRGDFLTPNEAYFAHLDYIISKAAEKGMLVMLTPAYMGYGGGSEGWYQEMRNNGATKLRAYGQYLAQRFSAHANLLWVHGGDFNPPERSLMRAIVNGIRDVDSRWLHTFHGERGTAALDFLGTSESWLSLNDIYTDLSTVTTAALRQYGASTMPYFLIESRYENEGADAHGIRLQAYQAMLSGAAGHLMGNNPIWFFGSGWKNAMNSGGARTLRHLRTLLEANAWWTLVPDTSGTLLTSGRGSGEGRAVASMSADGKSALIYLPSSRTITVNLTRFAGSDVVARWYDPTAGTYSAASGSPFPATTSRTFKSPASNSGGSSDWVLVLNVDD